jgi:glycosyltransferase involved in cell wall biosynthesis
LPAAPATLARPGPPQLDVLLLAQDEADAVFALVRSLPELRFGLIWLDHGSDAADFERLAADPPEHLLHLERRALRAGAPAPRGVARRAAEEEHAYAQLGRLHDLLRDPRDTPEALELLGRLLPGSLPSGPLDLAGSLASEHGWELLTARTRRLHPTEPFPALCGAVRDTHAMLAPLLEAARAAPAAGTIHALGLGAAGLLGVFMQKLRHWPLLVSDAQPGALQSRLRAWIDTDEPAAARDLRQRYAEALDRLALTCADCVVTDFEFQRQRRIADGADPRRTVCIAPGATPGAHARLDPVAGRAPPRVGVAGPLTPLQDIRTVLRALQIVLPYLPGIEAWIVGPGDEDPGYAQDCRALARGLGLEGQLHFSPSEAPEPARLGLMVSSAIAAGPCQSLIDALGAGLPCVCTDAGAARQLVYGLAPADIAVGSAGEVVAVADAQALAAAIVRLLGDGDAWLEASRAAAERAASFYSPVQGAEQWRALYAEALAGSLVAEDTLEDPA